MTAPLRNCRDCPEQSDCMASVLRHGPLLMTCEGMPYGWQEDWEGPMPPAKPRAARHPKGSLERLVLAYIAEHGGATITELKGVGISAFSQKMREMVAGGKLTARPRTLPRPQGGGSRIVVYELPAQEAISE